MTSPTILIQRAAELVIEFGLEHTGMTAQDVREEADDSGLIIQWGSRGASRKPEIELFIVRKTDGLKAWTCTESGHRAPADAKRIAALYGRVVELAERIEALR